VPAQLRGFGVNVVAVRVQNERVRHGDLHSRLMRTPFSVPARLLFGYAPVDGFVVVVAEHPLPPNGAYLPRAPSQANQACRHTAAPTTTSH
jgi:hypothetical protein